MKKIKEKGKQTPREPKNTESLGGLTKNDPNNVCPLCGHTYGDPEDPLIEDEWVSCSSCRRWWHESCSLESGATARIGFTCQGCGQ